MTLSQFKILLQDNRGKLFQVALPTGDQVPISFHITEVGRVEKTFLDCGGKLHTRSTAQLQVWVGPDEDHRIQAGKMADIVERSGQVVPDATLPLEMEYELENGFVSQFPVADFDVSEEAVVLHLGVRHTECLALDVCCPPIPAPDSVSLSMAPSSDCGCGPSCCR